MFVLRFLGGLHQMELHLSYLQHIAAAMRNLFFMWQVKMYKFQATLVFLDHIVWPLSLFKQHLQYTEDGTFLFLRVVRGSKGKDARVFWDNCLKSDSRNSEWFAILFKVTPVQGNWRGNMQKALQYHCTFHLCALSMWLLASKMPDEPLCAFKIWKQYFSW